MYVFDNHEESQAWWYWEFPEDITNAWTEDGKLRFLVNNKIVAFDHDEFVDELTDLSVYRDYDKNEIDWFFKTQIYSLGTPKYYKTIQKTGFIFVDSIYDEYYSLKFNYEIFRDSAYVVSETSVEDSFHTVRTTQRRSYIPRVGFAKLIVSNNKADEDEGEYSYKKPKIVSLNIDYTITPREVK